jgi:hypothetical protein
MRAKVASSAGAGVSHEQIAIALGISRTTLLKHFGTELSRAAYSRQMDVAHAMYLAAKKGNVAAQKAYMAMTPKASALPLPAPEAEKSPKLGKKEQANADAQVAQVGTDWDSLLQMPALPQ